jgi:hypothetical protein
VERNSVLNDIPTRTGRLIEEDVTPELKVYPEANREIFA